MLVIHVTYTYENAPEISGKTIKHAWFSEGWILSGNTTAEEQPPVSILR